MAKRKRSAGWIGAVLLVAAATGCTAASEPTLAPAEATPLPAITQTATETIEPTSNSSPAAIFGRSIPGFDLSPVDDERLELIRAALEESVGDRASIRNVEGVVATGQGDESADVYLFTIAEADDPTGQEALALIMEAMAGDGGLDAWETVEEEQAFFLEVDGQTAAVTIFSERPLTFVAAFGFDRPTVSEVLAEVLATNAE